MKVYLLIAFCSLSLASGRELLQSAYSTADYPITAPEVYLWNLHLWANNDSTDLVRQAAEIGASAKRVIVVT